MRGFIKSNGRLMSKLMNFVYVTPWDYATTMHNSRIGQKLTESET